MSTINVNTISPQSGSNLSVTSTKFTGSLLSTASFGRVQATTLGGNSPIEIDGEITGTISGSITSTASFGTYIGDGGQLSGIETLQRTGSDEVSGSARVFGPTSLTGSLIVSGSNIEYTNTLSGSLNSTASFDNLQTAGNVVFSGSKHDMNGELNLHGGSSNAFVVKALYGDGSLNADFTFRNPLGSANGGALGIRGYYLGVNSKILSLGANTGAEYWSFTGTVFSGSDHSITKLGHITASGDIHITGTGSFSGSIVSTGSFGEGYFSQGIRLGINGNNQALSNFTSFASENSSHNTMIIKSATGDVTIATYHGSEQWYMQNDSSPKGFFFKYNGDGVSGYPTWMMATGSTLNVGIGMTDLDDTNKLQVGGNALVTGSLTVNGNVTGSITSTGSFGKVNIADSIGKLSRITSSFTVDTGPATSAKITGKSFSNFILEWKNQSNNTVYSDHKLSAQGHDLGLYYGGSNDILRLRESNAIYHRWKTTNYVASHDAFEYSSSRTSIHKIGAISASGDVTIDGSGSLTVAGDIRTSGDVIAQNLIVSSSITHMTTSFSSGSTLFGDTIDDTHEFTGSVNITGSITLSGSLGASGHNVFVNRLYIGPDTQYGNNIRYGSPAGNIGFFRGDTQFIKFFRHSDGRGIIFASGGPGFLTYPTYTFDADFDTGMANPAHNNLGFYAHAAEIVRINGSGLEVKSGNISGSITCSITVGATGSFGKLIGDGSDLTGISSFAGAAGTETLFSGSITSTGSFDNLKLNNFDFQGVDSTPATSVIIGNNAFSYANDTASENDNSTVVAIGSNCIEQVVRTRQSVYIGSSVLQNFAGEVYRISGNVIIGNQAGRYMTAVSNVTVLGSSAGQTTLGANSVMIGSEANAGQYATAVGYQAGGQENNVSIGAFAGANLGGNGVYVGYEAGAGINNGSADQNTFLGGRAGKTDTAGSSLTNTSNTICIGWDTHATAGGTNEIVIGANAEGKGSNTTVIGNSSQTKVIFSGNAIISGSLTSTGSFGKLLGDASGLTNLPGGGIFADSSSYQGTQNDLQITGSVDITGSFSATAKSFVIPHPAKDQGFLQHGSLEGPEHGVYVRGHLKDDNEIILPDYWDPLVDESTISVQLTPIGTWQQLFVKEVSNSKVVVQNRLDGHSIDCYYVVQGERKDIPKIELEL